MIAKYQKENKEMKQMINQLNEKERRSDNDASVNTRSSSNNERDLQVWRRKLDDLKSKTVKKQEHLRGIQDKFNSLNNQVNTTPGAKKEGNDLKQVRILENRLDKAMIKFNEAISIKKTYEIILKRLKEERIAYDKQLESMEKAIKAKNADFDELLMLSHDANHAKHLAETDLKNYESQINTIR